MSKSHVVMLTIINNSPEDFDSFGSWFDSGRFADGWNLPDRVASGSTCVLAMNEKDWALAGCSGYINFEKGGFYVTVAFSNPSSGENKLGVGSGIGGSTWENMSSHDYDPFTVSFKSGRSALVANCRCTGGSVNEALVVFS